MIRRLNKHSDLKDLIKSCPSGVIDDIYAIEYYIQGYNTVIQANFTKKETMLEVIIPSTDLETLPNGILMRRAYYKVLDTSYPDGYYNLEFEDNMNVWIGENESEEPVIPEYVTEEELAETLEDYATQEWVSGQGYLTEETLPSDIATVSYVLSALDGYATESWVSEQGYAVDDPNDLFVTESALESVLAGDDNRVLREDDLGPYAQMEWVQNQDYVQYSNENPLGVNKNIIVSGGIYIGQSNAGIVIDTEGDSHGIAIYDDGSTEGIATQNWVWNELSGYATENWVQQQGYLDSNSTLPADQITCNISGDVFDFDDVDEGLRALVSRVEDQIDEITLLDDRVTALEQAPSAIWGSITGTITNQTDLMTLLGDYATQQWATNQFLEESKVWSGTEAQWNALTPAQQASYTIALITQ